MERPAFAKRAAWTALAAAALVASLGFWSFPPLGVPAGTDSAVFSYVGEVVAAGGMPYIDVFDHKGPLVYLVNALGALGPSTWLLWVFELAVLGATVFLGYALGLGVGASRAVAALVSASAAFYVVSRAEGGNMTEEYCLPFMLAAMLAAAQVVRGRALSPAASLAMGAGVAAVFFLRFTALVGVVPFCVWTLVLAWRRDGMRDALALVGWFALGALAVAAPLMAWMASGGALGAFIDQYLAFNLVYAGSGEGGGWLDALVFFALDPALIFAVAASAAALATLWRSKGGPGEGNASLLWVNLAGLGLLFGLAVATGRSYGHYSAMFAPGIVLALNAAAVQLERRGAPAAALAAGTAVAALVLVLVPSAYETYERTAWHKAVADERARVAQAVADAADGGEVLVIGNECWVYLDSGTRAPIPYAYRSDVMVEEYGEWLADLVSDDERAPSVIVAASYVPQEEYASAAFSDRYRVIEDTGSYTIHALKGAAPSNALREARH